MKINLNKYLNPYHKQFFQSTVKEVLLYGGAAAGKSYSVVDKLLISPWLQQKQLKIIVVRKSMPSLKRTCLALMEKRAATLQVPFELNRTDNVMTLPFNSKVYFVSIGHYSEIEKIKSITDADFLWCEEGNEITEEAYLQGLLRLRGGEGNYKQAIISFNPVGVTSWLYNKFFVKDNTATKFHYTADHNPYIEPEYINQLDSLKEMNENLWRVYRRGEWGNLEGTIYKNYEIIDKVPGKIDDTFYGIDFGYNNPSSLVRVYLSDGKPYIEEVIYESGLTNQDLIERMKSQNIGDSIIYADAAEPQRIEEIRRAGFNCLPADKSVNDGITFIQSMKLHILTGSENILKEIQSYSWMKDKDGRYVDKPTKFMDHAMDAIRYAVFTHLSKQFSFPLIGADGRINQSGFGSIFDKMRLQQIYGL